MMASGKNVTMYGQIEGRNIMDEERKLCSVVVPCFNEQEAIPIYYQEMTKTFEDIPELRFEFEFIDDGSKDDTLQVIKELRKKDDRVHYVSFSRNFGKEAAMYAGFCNAKGD